MKRLLVIYLRGGADLLTLVPPYGDSEYKKLRPLTAVTPDEMIAIDPMFGLHASFEALMPVWDAGEMAVIPGTCSSDRSFSHFTAWDRIEQPMERIGWAARLADLRSDIDRSVGIVSMQSCLPRSMFGSPKGIGMDDYSTLLVRDSAIGERFSALGWLDDECKDSVDNVLRADSLVRTLQPNLVETSTEIPDSAMGRACRRMVQMIRSDFPVSVAIASTGSYDTHNAVKARIAPLWTDVAKSLSAMWNDLGAARQDLTVVVASEFGRRAYENGSAGNDHGLGGFCMVMDTNLRSGLDARRWQGLGRDALYEGSVPQCADIHEVMADVLASRLDVSNAHLQSVLGTSARHGVMR